MMEIGFSYCGTDGQIFTAEETSRTRLTKRLFMKIRARDAGALSPSPAALCAAPAKETSRATSRCPSSRRTHWSTRSRSLRRARACCARPRRRARRTAAFPDSFRQVSIRRSVFGDARRAKRAKRTKRRGGKDGPRLWRAQRCVSRSILSGRILRPRFGVRDPRDEPRVAPRSTVHPGASGTTPGALRDRAEVVPPTPGTGQFDESRTSYD